MSWLFNSNHSSHLNDHTVIHSSPPQSAAADRHGFKDDISHIFRGVANFLAPPPSSSSSSSATDSSSSSSSSSSEALTGIRNDLEEIGGSFKNSLSRISSNKAVTGISKFASQLLQLESDQQRSDDDAVPGTTDDVVRFVLEISARPQYWTEFPLPLPHEFSMSNSQREHVLAIERLVPEFVALRLSLCSYMNVEKFWMIYFLLILPRLNQRDLELLSTAKIIEARYVLLQKLGEKKSLQAGEPEKPRTEDTYQESREDSGRDSISYEQNRILTEVTNAVEGLEVDDTISSEKWLEDTDIDANSLASCTKLQPEEDVSFSDLDDDRSYSSDKLSGYREAQDIRGSSPEATASDWVQLRESSERDGRKKAIRLKGKDSEDESNDWLTVDDFN